LSLLHPFSGRFHFHQELIEGSAIKQPAGSDYELDFPRVLDVFDWVSAEQHQISDLAWLD
jgi:hypothetical protein